MRRIIQLAQDEKEYSISGVQSAMADSLGIAVGPDFEADYMDAIDELKQMDALCIVRRGEFRVTKKGLRLLWSHTPLS